MAESIHHRDPPPFSNRKITDHVGICTFVTHLKEVGPDLLVRAVPGQLLGQLGDALAGIGQSLRASDQFSFRAFATTDQLAGIGRPSEELVM